MTQTPSAQESERLTSRQRRIQEQRRKIDAAAAQQRRRRLSLVVGIVIVVAVAIAAVVMLMPRSVGAQMHQVVTEPGSHVDEGGPLSYRNRPPSSGVHFGTLPQQFEYRLYDQPLSPGRWVHMLEHGAVVILYRPDLCDAACLQTLGEVYDAAPRSSLVGVRHLAITPYQDMDHAIAVVAWGAIDELDQADKERMLADFKSRVDAPSAPERGAL